jgi:hypothetical protein
LQLVTCHPSPETNPAQLTHVNTPHLAVIDLAPTSFLSPEQSIHVTFASVLYTHEISFPQTLFFHFVCTVFYSTLSRLHFFPPLFGLTIRT